MPGVPSLNVRSATLAAVLICTPLAGEQPAVPKLLGHPATQATDSTPATRPDTHTLTADDLGAYLDGIIPQQLKREDIAGAVVFVVKDGSVLFQKGYGYADVAAKVPMSPDGTIVRPGSTSKLFTWTAVMQQVEQGRIDLDRDVDDYLDFKIPATSAQPITMRNLMTHTAGFEEVAKDLIVGPNNKRQSIRDYLRTHIPPRIYAPGTIPAYSNYGATLAGYIVQRLSGMSFEEYTQKNIFGPLDMRHTTFAQPLPQAWQPMMSKGYTVASGKRKTTKTSGLYRPAVPQQRRSTSRTSCWRNSGAGSGTASAS